MKISELALHYHFKNATPGDPSGLNLPRQTPGMLWASTKPRIASQPRLLLSSPSCEQLLGLSSLAEDFEQAALYLSGSKLWDASSPYSTRYGGHQFGHWADQLGDGRAITLGEVESAQGRFELQLKGAGQSAYSRRGDGLAVLRSSLREFLCSEAMHALNVPTTRALSLCLTGDQVMRDMFYDGNPKFEPGAVVARVAPSFLRFGHFQLLAAHAEKLPFKALITYVLETYFSHHKTSQLDQWALSSYQEICEQTALLICHWMRVGFVHGVMNTDNMSIHSLTIDYGPYGWMESYDTNWTPNTTDFESRRYRFGAQPAVAAWNLARLGEAFMAYFGASEEWNQAHSRYSTTFNQEIARTYAQKLGLHSSSAQEVMTLLGQLEELFTASEFDFTIFYRELSSQYFQTQILEDGPNWSELHEIMGKSLYQEKPTSDLELRLQQWLEQYRSLLLVQELGSVERSQKMEAVNPYFILRNYLVQESLDQFSRGDESGMKSLFEALQTPYQCNEKTLRYYQKRPEWARHRPGCSTLSCSS